MPILSLDIRTLRASHAHMSQTEVCEDGSLVVAGRTTRTAARREAATCAMDESGTVEQQANMAFAAAPHLVLTLTAAREGLRSLLYVQAVTVATPSSKSLRFAE